MSKRLKIGLDARDLRIAKTGNKTFLEELIREFKLLENDKYKFYFFDTIIPVYTGKNKLLKAIEHLRFFTWKQFTLPLKALFKGCDIIFCTDYFVPYIHLGFKPIPVFHDAFFFEYPEHYNKLWLYLFKLIGIPAARKSPFIITPSFYTRERISHFLKLDKDRIRPIHEGPKTIKPTGTSEFPEELSKKYILHVGTIEKRKNLISLLEAYKVLSRNNPWLKLILIGQSSPKKDMNAGDSVQSFVKNNQLEKDVLLPGYVSDEELGTYYSNALLYIFPSINEGFGIPVLEAFKYDLPVLVANNTCLPEIGGDAVIAFDPFNPTDIVEKTELVLKDENFRKQMISKGRKRLQQFSWAKAAEQLCSVFEEALKKNGTSY